MKQKNAKWYQFDAKMLPFIERVEFYLRFSSFLTGVGVGIIIMSTVAMIVFSLFGGN